MRSSTIILLLISIFFISDFSMGQRRSSKKNDGPVLYFKGEWKNDTYRDKRKSVVYRMDEKGGVTDKNDHQIIIVVGNSYRNYLDEVIGRFHPNGDVRTSQGRLLGKIDSYGEIRGPFGAYISDLNGLTPEQAAVQYFLWDEMIKREERLRGY